MKRALLIFALLIINISTIFHFGNGRSMKNDISALASDRDDYDGLLAPSTRSDAVGTTTVTCEAMYGFLPCSTTLLGLLFLIVVYEVLLSFGERYVSAGSDLFFETFGTGVVGSSIFHLFGTIPQVGLILVTGITASSDDLEDMVGISMGLLVGKTIMSLTLIWGLVIAFGSRDLSQPQETTSSSSDQAVLDSDEPNAKPFSLTGYGVTSDVETSHTARIMLVSLIPFLILAFAKIFRSYYAIRVLILVALIVTIALLVSYLIIQGFQPWIQNRRLEFVLRKYIRRNLLQSLLTAGRKPNVPVIREIFHRIDKDNNSYISTLELKALILGLQVEETGLHDHDFVSRVMEQFDATGDTKISEAEFVKALSNWLIAAKDDSANDIPKKKQKLFASKEKKTSGAEEQQSLIAREEESIASNYEVWLNYTKAGLLIILGTAITIVLGQPLVESLANFSSAANIPSFLIAYIVIPIALNFRQALSAVSSAKHKTEKDISLTLSEIYNGIFMNNLVSMVVFLALVYIRDLSTDVSAEVLVILIICLCKGLYASFNTTFNYWTCIVAFILYPASLLFMYFLTAVVGWS